MLEKERCQKIAEGDYVEALKLNHDFHDRIYAIASNDHALKLLKSNRIPPRTTSKRPIKPLSHTSLKRTDSNAVDLSNAFGLLLWLQVISSTQVASGSCTSSTRLRTLQIHSAQYSPAWIATKTVTATFTLWASRSATRRL
ncbi:hypothetical protein QTL95_02365 [Rhizobium sp. S152]|uniref:hypothetical protein n=1 Tax=Rhizobium sp. S152 TaxID=3055038 RepID=UPI0025A9AD41|nr:hypothetical protein [Rhizobium sp. S152]MDM9624722.1 hypothetical protein [Rhizobium sp. S152]